MVKTKKSTKKVKTTTLKKRTKLKSASKKVKKKLAKKTNTVPKKRGRPRKLDKLKNNSKRGRPKKPKPSFPGTEPENPPPTLPIDNTGM